VSQRFQIEDLISQDASGVVFRATDTKTGRTVALRRFFPFGVDGGGLSADEQTAYNIAVGRLAGLHHPALRAVISGGCDPVDGIPFIATEWIEGEMLQPILAQRPISAEAAARLIAQALEVCELLSHVFAEEAVWVETDLQTIIVGSRETRRGFTFWISPLKWLGGRESARRLDAIIALTEEIMGWQGRIVNEEAGHGLGGWLNWLRSAAATASLREVRENLAAAIGAEPPPHPGKLIATRPPRGSIKPSASKTPLLLAFACALAVTGLGGWLLTQPMPQLRLPIINPQKPARTDEAPPLEPVSPIVAQPAEAALPLGAIPWSNRDFILKHEGLTVTVEGVVRQIDASKSGKTLYLRFADETDTLSTRASIPVGIDFPPRGISDLQPFSGKKVRVTGEVDVRRGRTPSRPEIKLKSLGNIELVE
jgi:hypothetical protein